MSGKKSADHFYRKNIQEPYKKSNKPLIYDNGGGLYSYRNNRAVSIRTPDQPRYFSNKQSVSNMSKRNSEDHARVQYKSLKALQRKGSPNLPINNQVGSEYKSNYSKASKYHKISQEGSEIQRIFYKLR